MAFAGGALGLARDLLPRLPEGKLSTASGTQEALFSVSGPPVLLSISSTASRTVYISSTPPHYQP